MYIHMFIIKWYFSRTYYRWKGTVHLPAEKPIFYRYFVGFILKPEENQKEIFVHSWESHDEPRVVKFVNGMLLI